MEEDERTELFYSESRFDSLIIPALMTAYCLSMPEVGPDPD